MFRSRECSRPLVRVVSHARRTNPDTSTSHRRSSLGSQRWTTGASTTAERDERGRGRGGLEGGRTPRTPGTLRDIVLPRPLPNPPEYGRELRERSSARVGMGDREDRKDWKDREAVSLLTRLRDGLRLYASTWTSTRDNSVSHRDDRLDGAGNDTNAAKDTRTEGIRELLDEVRLDSATVGDVARHQYAIRARAFQLAVKEFVVGWHETRKRA